MEGNEGKMKKKGKKLVSVRKIHFLIIFGIFSFCFSSSFRFLLSFQLIFFSAILHIDHFFPACRHRITSHHNEQQFHSMGEHSSEKWPTLIMVKRNLNKRFAIIEEHTSRPVNLMETFPIYHMRIDVLRIGLESMVYISSPLCGSSSALFKDFLHENSNENAERSEQSVINFTNEKLRKDPPVRLKSTLELSIILRIKDTFKASLTSTRSHSKLFASAAAAWLCHRKSTRWRLCV